MLRRIFRNRNLKYNLMFIGNKMGIISNKRWELYCEKIFNKILSEHEDVFKRLKNS